MLCLLWAQLPTIEISIDKASIPAVVWLFMEEKTIRGFLAYYDKVHFRTSRLLPLIPSEQFEFRPAEDKFSFADLLRHLAASERYMFVELALGNQNHYPGHGSDLAAGKKNVLSYYEALHLESRKLLATLSDQDLNNKSVSPVGASITTWKWLRLMLEHEIHHRGQIYLMLGLIGVKTPPIFGLTSEDLQDTAV